MGGLKYLIIATLLLTGCVGLATDASIEDFSKIKGHEEEYLHRTIIIRGTLQTKGLDLTPRIPGSVETDFQIEDSKGYLLDLNCKEKDRRYEQTTYEATGTLLSESECKCKTTTKNLLGETVETEETVVKEDCGECAVKGTRYYFQCSQPLRETR